MAMHLQYLDSEKKVDSLDLSRNRWFENKEVVYARYGAAQYYHHYG